MFFVFRICEYVILHSQRDSADVIKLKILRWDYSESSEYIQWSHNDSRKTEARGPRLWEEVWQWKQGLELHTLRMKEGAELKEGRQFLHSGEVRNGKEKDK